MSIEKPESGNHNAEEPYLCELLAQQMLIWFDDLVQKNQPPVKIFSGIKSDLQQFICQMRDVPIGLGDHISFMAEVLNVEDCIAFAYSMRMAKDSTPPLEVLVIISGQAGAYRSYEYKYTSSGLTLNQEHPSQKPLNFFQELLHEYYRASPKKEEFLNAWNEVRPNLIWRQIKPPSKPA